MALVAGTNCGFVTTAPTADPTGGGGDFGMAGLSRGLRDTAPATGTVTEIGWWVNSGISSAQNYEVGLYSDDGGGASSLPVTLQAGADTSNVLGSIGSWQVVTGLSISIVNGTLYWIGVQLDYSGNSVAIDTEVGVLRRSVDTSASTALPATWTNAGAANNGLAFYALYTAGGGSTPEPDQSFFMSVF